MNDTLNGRSRQFAPFTSASSAIKRLSGIALAVLVGGASAAAFAAQTQPTDPHFTNYVQKIPGQSVTFGMVAIPGGEITIGSPTSEAGRAKADLAQKKVTVKPFWMGKCEVSWDEFYPYVFIDLKEVVRQSKPEGLVDKDGISHPSRPYTSAYRERGEKGFPAIGMGYPAAREYCKWLSKKTGLKYRLATEEEWEYACRAGATTAYFWGDDPEKAKDYAWFKDNSNETTHPVGKLKPNKFGLYDIVGNVVEWTAAPSANASAVARGGAWSEPVSSLRCAARMFETPEWNEYDPNSPKSIWWLSSSDFIGFRVVRSLGEDPVAQTEIQTTVVAKPAATTTAAVNAQADYKQQCAACHGADGKGQTKIGKTHKVRDYTSAAVKAVLKDDAMFKAIKEGIKEGDKMTMSAYADKLTDEQIKALVAYMKKF
jgi:formylglycine-generating enzyme required for sulfatase activity/mono/diheme cytochrome c family protein